MTLGRRPVGAIIVSLFFTVLLFSCKKEEVQWTLDMPPTPIMTGTTGWGVVNTAYLKINRDPDDDQFVVTTLREGDIVQIESVHFLKSERGQTVSIWYQIQWEDLKGWVRDSYLDPFDTREKAVTGSKVLLNRNSSP